MHIKTEIVIVLWFYLDCCTSLALHARTVSKMPRKKKITAKTAMDRHRCIICHIRCNQYELLKKNMPWSSTCVRYRKETLGARATVGVSNF